MEIAVPAEAVSCAYAKMEETLAVVRLADPAPASEWSRSAARGGAQPALLARGLVVTGIDPAQVAPQVLAHPRFTHVRKRGADVRRREFRGIDWLAVNMNVAPAFTLDTVEAIVTHPEVNIRGLLVTLKLLDWQLADEIPSYLERVAAGATSTCRRGSWHIIAKRFAWRRDEGRGASPQHAGIDALPAVWRFEQQCAVGGDAGAAAHGALFGRFDRQLSAALQAEILKPASENVGRGGRLAKGGGQMLDETQQQLGAVEGAAGQLVEAGWRRCTSSAAPVKVLLTFKPMPTTRRPPPSKSISTPDSFFSATKTSFGQCKPIGCWPTCGATVSMIATPAASDCCVSGSAAGPNRPGRTAG